MFPPVNRGHEAPDREARSSGESAQPAPGSSAARPRLAIVGVCGSGKSLLAEKLSGAGYDARPVAQEHSLVPALFRHGEPDAVIFLEATDETVARRKRSGWEPHLLKEQRGRLRLARREADIVLVTDEIDPDELAAQALRRLAGIF
ncbi:MAG: hypothetical protein C4534_05495 [Gaiellales bacterium]|nr:MAG: hypothetical protein C4534_05495 [Gaiellales bacterium]